MFREEENHVALFIDWDNLAISTAADFGGASPDVRAIVHVAQRFGTVLIARAYAEWQVPSDRLSVYRSGVDPIYAPTFRFEPDPVNAPPRGKSLADPCLVADCIDTLHLMPAVNHFVLVSGDKDLIPIVRLVQLRGRRVVVIGPDYVAAILRDMADEYVSYRSIVESGEAVATPDTSPSRGRRRGTQRSGPPAPAPVVAAPVVQPAPGPVAQPAPVVQAAPVAQPAPVVSQPAVSQPLSSAQPILTARPQRNQQPYGRSASFEAPPAAPARSLPFEPPVVELEEAVSSDVAEEEAIAEPAMREGNPEELKGLFATIAQILNERESQGKTRLRATNLKDLLMARIHGFNERRYGFSRFKDVLSAAEKAGILEVNREGPVHWVTLPRKHEEPRPVAEPVAIAPAEETPVEPMPVGERDRELIGFIADLRSRSRWLTYTYVLTNLITHLSLTLPPAAAEAEARSALGRLVQEGVLRVDREPREIEVGGARHRVRMCHLEEDNPVVQSVLAAAAEAPADGAVAQAPETDETVAQTEPAAPPSSELSAAPAQPVPAPAPRVEEPAAPPAPPPAPWFGRDTYELPPLPNALLAPSPSSAAAEATARASAPVQAEPVAAAVEPAAPEVASQPAATEPSAEQPAAEAPAAAPAANGNAESTAPALADVFAALRDVVRATVSAEKPIAGAAAIKTRLGRRLGSFDERSFGFGKFKDFLLAAQREGFVRVDILGQATRVGLPIEEPAR